MFSKENLEPRHRCAGLSPLLSDLLVGKHVLPHMSPGTKTVSVLLRGCGPSLKERYKLCQLADGSSESEKC